MDQMSFSITPLIVNKISKKRNALATMNGHVLMIKIVLLSRKNNQLRRNLHILGNPLTRKSFKNTLK